MEEQLFLGLKRIVRTCLSSKGEKNEQRNNARTVVSSGSYHPQSRSPRSDCFPWTFFAA